MVFQPNYRGSDNAGNAFTRAILDDSGAGPGRDVMAGVGELKKRGFVDDSRIAVGGWSYGGYMTSWMIGHYPIFDTGDVRVPVVQSYQLYRALRDNEVPVKFIAYPVNGHSPEDPLRQADIEKRYVEWFAQYLK